MGRDDERMAVLSCVIKAAGDRRLRDAQIGRAATGGDGSACLAGEAPSRSWCI